VRWIKSRTRKSDRRRGHESMRKHVVQRKILLEVVNKHSLRANGHILLRTNSLCCFICS
jgi:hypothetical protein